MHTIVTPLGFDLSFTTAYGSTTRKENKLLTITDGKHYGFGEILLVDPSSPRYPLQESQIRKELARWQQGRMPSDRQVCAALETAIADYAMRRDKTAINPTPAISYRTLSITDDLDAGIASLAKAPKVKIKASADERYLCAVLGRLEGRDLIVDPNCSWTPQHALRMLPILVDRVAIVEQAFPADMNLRARQPAYRDEIKAWRRVADAYRDEGVALYADESIIDRMDLDALRPLIHGVVVKIEKQGGLRRTRQILRDARARGLGTTLGSNLVSSLGISAASTLVDLADHIDLDGATFIAEDPFAGTHLAPDGKLIYDARVGIAQPR
jgi:L-alanine-DL-glutamate epimerase-like enolase superfamily enzyme